eukprot:3188947-Prymnesium_polylepis.2
MSDPRTPAASMCSPHRSTWMVSASHRRTRIRLDSIDRGCRMWRHCRKASPAERRPQPELSLA